VPPGAAAGSEHSPAGQAELRSIALAAAAGKGTSSSTTKVRRCQLPGLARAPLTVAAVAGGELRAAFSLAMALP